MTIQCTQCGAKFTSNNPEDAKTYFGWGKRKVLVGRAWLCRGCITANCAKVGK